jgi:Fe-S cluster assembly protein SufD
MELATQHITEQFNTLEQGLNGQRDTKLHSIRKAAFDAFMQLGIPTKRHEEWKYTGINTLLPASYSLLNNAGDSGALSFNKYNAIEGSKLIFINGRFSKQHSNIAEQSGVTLLSLSEALSSHHEPTEKHYGTIGDNYKEHFAALNTAFAQDGAVIHIAKNTVATLPVFIIHLFTGNADTFIQPRNLVVVEDNAEVTIIEDFQSSSPALYNHAAEIITGKNAHVHYTVIQDTKEATGIYNYETVLERDSSFTINTISLSGKVIRNNITARLRGENATANLNGLYYANGTSHIDNHVLVDHIVPNCQSNQLYKGILDGEGTGVFNGKIFVKPDAQKTNAFQSSKAVMLSMEATMNSKPQLEIFADDVKCSHGAAIGQLSDNELFYLLARGIEKDNARAILTYAFAAELLTKINHEGIRAILDERLKDILKLTF